MSNHLYKFNFVLDEKFQQYKVPRATFSLDLRNQFYSYMDQFAAEILSTMESDKTSLGTLDMWINFYTVGDFNEIHCTNSEEYVQRCNYTGILILELDNNEILTVYDEQNSEPVNYALYKGDCYVVRNDILRGIKPVSGRLIVAMFMIQT